MLFIFVITVHKIHKLIQLKNCRKKFNQFKIEKEIQDQYLLSSDNRTNKFLMKSKYLPIDDDMEEFKLELTMMNVCDQINHRNIVDGIKKRVIHNYIAVYFKLNDTFQVQLL